MRPALVGGELGRVSVTVGNTANYEVLCRKGGIEMQNKSNKSGGCCCGCIILAVAIGAVVGIVVAIARKVIPVMMPKMMAEMMPHCLRMILPDMPQKERVDFVLKLTTILMEKGSAGMSEEEKGDLLAKVAAKVDGANTA